MPSVLAGTMRAATPCLRPSLPSTAQAAASHEQPRSLGLLGGFRRRGARFTATSGAASMLVAVAAASSRRRCPQRRTAAHRRAVKVALRASQTSLAVESDDYALSAEEMRDAFQEASGGSDVATFDQSIRLEGVDEALEEGAMTLKELEFLWGDLDAALGFEDWAKWYSEVVDLYDEFLAKDAQGLPSELLMEDVQEELDNQREYTDEELFEDAPAQNTQISELLKDREEELAKRGMQKQLPPGAQEEQPAVEQQAVEGRENIEITRLFREECDEENLLSFEALLEVSEIREMLQGEEITESELEVMWDALPVKDGRIDILGFRDLIKKIDDLFDYEDEEGEPGGTSTLSADAGLEIVSEEAKKPASVRKPEVVKSDLQTVLQGLEEVEKKPLGLDGREETDPGVTKLIAELEEKWRDEIVDLQEFDENTLLGDWELLYSTSAKYRRWRSILNGQKFVKGGELDGMTQNFSIEPGTQAHEYDMEEIYLREGKELGMRAVGAWSVGLQSNVVTGSDDLVLKLNITQIEYDKEDQDVPEEAEKKLLESQMVRTFSYSFISFVDQEILILRTGFTSQSTFIFNKMAEDAAKQ